MLKQSVHPDRFYTVPKHIQVESARSLHSERWLCYKTTTKREYFFHWSKASDFDSHRLETNSLLYLLEFSHPISRNSYGKSHKVSLVAAATKTHPGVALLKGTMSMGVVGFLHCLVLSLRSNGSEIFARPINGSKIEIQ